MVYLSCCFAVSVPLPPERWLSGERFLGVVHQSDARMLGTSVSAILIGQIAERLINLGNPIIATAQNSHGRIVEKLTFTIWRFLMKVYPKQ